MNYDITAPAQIFLMDITIIMFFTFLRRRVVLRQINQTPILKTFQHLEEMLTGAYLVLHPAMDNLVLIVHLLVQYKIDSHLENRNG